MRDLCQAFPQLFKLIVTPNGTLAVVPEQHAMLPQEAIKAIDAALAAGGGTMLIEELRAALPESVKNDIVPFRSLTKALASVPHEFVLQGKTHVQFPPAKASLTADHQRRELATVIGDTPPYLVPLSALSEANGEGTLRVTLERVMSRTDVFDVVTPVMPTPGPHSPDAEWEAFALGTFVRVLPPFHDVCSAEARERYLGHMAEDYDAYRLARFLTTMSPRAVSDLEHEAASVLTKPLMQVVHSFPELFDYDPAGHTVKFILRPDMKPSEMRQYTDEEIDERIAKFRSQLAEMGKVKFEKAQVKSKIQKLQNAKLIRANPHGSTFMDANVLAMIIYDTLPETGSIATDQVAEMLPAYTRDTHHRFTRHFLTQFPHLFTVYQVKPPSYLVQRADVPVGGDLVTSWNGIEFKDFTLDNVADCIIELAKEKGLEADRPTQYSTILFRLPFMLRQHMRQQLMRLEHIVAAKPGELMQVEVGRDNRWIMFTGPLSQVLKPCTRYENFNAPATILDGKGTVWQAPAPPTEPHAARDAPPTVTAAAEPNATPDPLQPTRAKGRGWAKFEPAIDKTV
jgi:hypothetical protein